MYEGSHQWAEKFWKVYLGNEELPVSDGVSGRTGTCKIATDDVRQSTTWIRGVIKAEFAHDGGGMIKVAPSERARKNNVLRVARGVAEVALQERTDIWEIRGDDDSPWPASTLCRACDTRRYDARPRSKFNHAERLVGVIHKRRVEIECVVFDVCA